MKPMNIRLGLLALTVFSAIRYTGTWHSRDGIIQLKHTTGILASFLPEGGKLTQLSPGGDRITGEQYESIKAENRILVTYLRKPKTMQQLHGEWVMDYILAPGKDPKLLYERQQPYIRFDTAGNKVAGSTGCNRFNGPYITENHHLHFDMAKMVLTRMACKGEGEGVFLDALKKVTRYTLSNDMLLFLQDDMVIMRWKKKS